MVHPLALIAVMLMSDAWENPLQGLGSSGTPLSGGLRRESRGYSRRSLPVAVMHGTLSPSLGKTRAGRNG